LPDLSAQNCPEKASPLLDDPSSQKLWNDMEPEDRESVNSVFSNIGKAIAAFERLILPTPSRFDQYVAALLKGNTEKLNNTLTAEEITGMRLFIGQGTASNAIKARFLQTMIFIIFKFPKGEKSLLTKAGQTESKKS